MAHKFLLIIALIGSSFLLMPTQSYACDTQEHSTLELEQISLNDLKTHADLYNFRTGHCASLSKLQKGVTVSDFVPSDETSLGIFQYYLNKGETQVDALKDTLEFNVHEQES